MFNQHAITPPANQGTRRSLLRMGRTKSKGLQAGDCGHISFRVVFKPDVPPAGLAAAAPSAAASSSDSKYAEPPPPSPRVAVERKSKRDLLFSVGSKKKVAAAPSTSTPRRTPHPSPIAPGTRTSHSSSRSPSRARPNHHRRKRCLRCSSHHTSPTLRAHTLAPQPCFPPASLNAPKHPKPPSPPQPTPTSHHLTPPTHHQPTTRMRSWTRALAHTVRCTSTSSVPRTF